MIISPFPNAMGLDISDLSIKVIQLRNLSIQKNRPAFELLSARSTTLPHGLIMDGVLEQPETVRKYLHHILQKKSRRGKTLKSPWLVASLPDSQGFLKLIHVDKEPGDIIDEDVQIAAQKHVPLEENNYYLDWQIMPAHTHTTAHTDILLAAIPKYISDMYTYLFDSLGLVPIALELRALATARALITADKNYTDEARALLDIGATHSTLTIYDHDYIQFSRSLSFSGEILTTAIAQKLHVPYEEAEELKKRYGLEFKKSKTWTIASYHVDRLIDEIKDTLHFYYTHFPDTHNVTHITMCGGGAAMSRLDRVLSMKLNIPTEPGNVWKNLHASEPVQVDHLPSLTFATAIGLALRAAENPFFAKDAM